MKSYVFILCPPYSGSTVLWKLVSTSNSVSSLPKEGQFIPEVKEVMRKAPWDSDVRMPWGTIKNVWDSYWDQEKTLLLEKSPPNIMRAKEILEYFNPIYFLISVRNPYAHCEGLIRRNNLDAVEAAEFTVRCLRLQKENVGLKNALRFTYEELVADPGALSQKIQSFIPNLGVLNYDSKFRCHTIDGLKEQGIVDLNKKKIENLSPIQLVKINRVLNANQEIMSYWGYKLYNPYLLHTLLFIKRKNELFFSNLSTKAKSLVAKAARRLTKRST